MKKVFIAIALIALSAFSAIQVSDNKKNQAEVNEVQGLYVFTDSKPIAEYEYLGTVKNGMRLAGSSQYQPVRDILIKKVNKEFPQADGVIFHFVNGAADKADAIKFK